MTHGLIDTAYLAWFVHQEAHLSMFNFALEKSSSKISVLPTLLNDSFAGYKILGRFKLFCLRFVFIPLLSGIFLLFI